MRLYRSLVHTRIGLMLDGGGSMPGHHVDALPKGIQRSLTGGAVVDHGMRIVGAEPHAGRVQSGRRCFPGSVQEVVREPRKLGQPPPQILPARIEPARPGNGIEDGFRHGSLSNSLRRLADAISG